MSASEITFEIILEKLKQANLNNRIKILMFKFSKTVTLCIQKFIKTTNKFIIHL